MSELSASAIKASLKTRIMGQKVLYYVSVSSTMDLARKAAREGAPEGTLVIAEEQTAGRGRLGRAWMAPPGSSLLCSLLFRPRLVDLPQLTLIGSLAAAHAIEHITTLEAAIKWPNDVLVRGKKVCGLLVESEMEEDILLWAIMGMGMNVNLDPKQFPPMPTPPTSLSAELGSEVPRLPLLKAILEEIERLYLGLRRGEPVYQAWRSRLVTLGRRVKVTSREGTEEGVAEDVDEDGALLLRRDDGTRARILAADVTLRS